VFVGTVLGVLPFLVLGVAFPSLLRTDRYLSLGVVPLILVPLTFAYAIVRFQFFDIRVIIRRSLLYTLTSLVVGVTYAVAIAAFTCCSPAPRSAARRTTRCSSRSSSCCCSTRCAGACRNRSTASSSARSTTHGARSRR